MSNRRELTESDVQTKVFVYRNLHNGCYSVRAMEGPNKGKVIGHADNVLMYDVSFKVSKAGRARVLREKAKNVHAGVVGYLGVFSNGEVNVPLPGAVKVAYNPYKYESFVIAANEAPVHFGKVALLTGRGLVVML